MAEEKNKKESLTSDFSALLDAVKDEAEAKKAEASSRDLQGRLSTVMAEKGHNLQGQALKEMQELQAILAGNKYDDIEKQKEANAVAEEKLKRLGEIAENTEG